VDVLDAYGDLQGGESEVPDPYVRLRLNDDGEDKLSSILDNTLTPEWHDSFEFDLPGKYGRGKYAETFNDGGVPAMLNLSIWDKDTFGRDDLLVSTLPSKQAPALPTEYSSSLRRAAWRLQWVCIRTD
jgi:hypothetical protein